MEDLPGSSRVEKKKGREKKRRQDKPFMTLGQVYFFAHKGIAETRNN